MQTTDEFMQENVDVLLLNSKGLCKAKQVKYKTKTDIKDDD